MQLDKKKTPPKPSKKIEPKVETKEKTSPKKDKNKSEETSKPKAPKTESTASKSKSTSPDVIFSLKNPVIYIQFFTPGQAQKQGEAREIQIS